MVECFYEHVFLRALKQPMPCVQLIQQVDERPYCPELLLARRILISR
jgi:hypothetical protein